MKGHSGSKNKPFCLKVSIVNQNGETILDTLVDYTTERVQKTWSKQNSQNSSTEEQEPTKKVSERLKARR